MPESRGSVNHNSPELPRWSSGYDRRMHPHLSAALARLDSARSDLRAAVEAVPGSLRAQKPAPDRWSVNDVLEHLVLVERTFLSSVVGKIVAAQAAGLASEVPQPQRLPEEMETRVRDRGNRRIAPDPVQPKGSVDAGSALKQLEDGHTQLRQAVTAADGLALSTVTHDHRFFGTLNVYQWIELVAGHEARHTEQLREIATEISAT